MLDDVETTISLSLPDGSMTPPVPLSVAKAALDTMKRRPRPSAKAAQPEPAEGQSDLEDFTAAGSGERPPFEAPDIGSRTTDRLRSLVERIERLEEERKALGSDIKDIYSEAKSAGFDCKVLRALISVRKKESAEVEEAETMLDVYRRALGM